MYFEGFGTVKVLWFKTFEKQMCFLGSAFLLGLQLDIRQNPTNTWDVYFTTLGLIIGYDNPVFLYSFSAASRNPGFKITLKLGWFSSILQGRAARQFSVLRLENWKEDWKAIEDRLCSESLVRKARIFFGLFGNLMLGSEGFFFKNEAVSQFRGAPTSKHGKLYDSGTWPI